jgi:L-threonylcarbamoyladenylate synthase
VAAPSANRYQTISPTQAHHVLHTLEGSVELVLDGGPCAEGIESTVVDVSEPGAPVVLRPGASSLGQLQSVVPSTVARATTVAEDSLRPSPGMDRRHYAPDAFVCMVHGRAALVERVAGEGLGGRQVGVLLCGESEALAGATVRTLPSNPAAYARGLFAALHELDRSGVHAIVVEEPPSGMDWWAVRDRLDRAACR